MAFVAEEYFSVALEGIVEKYRAGRRGRRDGAGRGWKSTSAPGAPNNSSPSHFSAMTRSCWLGRAVGNRHRHAIEQASCRWREDNADERLLG